MSEDQKQQQQNAKPVNARKILIRNSPIDITEGHPFSKIIKEMQERILNTQDFPEDERLKKFIDQLEELKIIGSRLRAVLSSDLTTIPLYVAPQPFVVTDLKVYVMKIISDFFQIFQSLINELTSYTRDNVKNTDNRKVIIEMFTTVMNVFDSFYSQLAVLAINIAQILDFNLPTEQASRIAESALSGYHMISNER